MIREVFLVFVTLLTCSLSNNSTTVPPSQPVSSPEVWRRIQLAATGTRLHHSDECDPQNASRLFKKLINLKIESITETVLQTIENDISNSCDWRRYMTCDTTRHRCVCAVDAIWIKRPNGPVKISNTGGMVLGECLLLGNGTCYGSEKEHRRDPRNVLGIDPPYARCLANMSCQNRSCKCTHPGTKECHDAENIFQTGVRNLKQLFKAFKWAQYGDPCDFGSKLTIDLRINTLRSLTLAATAYKDKGESLERICDFYNDLECYPDNGNRLGTKGTCQCKKGSTWYRNKCRGEHGSLCQIRMWAEADAIPYRTKSPCMPELTCTKVKYYGTEATVGACCFTGIYQYRTHEMNRTQMYLCSTGVRVKLYDYAGAFFLFLIMTTVSHLLFKK